MDQQLYRPRSILELVDATVRLVRANFATLVTLALVAYLPAMLFFALVTGIATQEEPDVAALGTIFLLAFGLVFWYVLFDGAIVRGAMEAYLGRRPTAGSALRFAASRYLRLLGTNVLKYLLPALPFVLVPILAATLSFVAAIAFIAVLVIGVVLYVRLAIIPTTVLHEDNGVVAGIRRSIELTGGHGVRVFLGIVLIYLIWLVIYIAFYALGALIFRGNPVVTAMFGQVSAALGYPLLSTFIALLYFDLRIRKEAYDIELMSQAIPAGGARAATT